MNRDMQIAEAVREAVCNSISAFLPENKQRVVENFGREVNLAAIITSVPKPEPFEIDWPEYHSEAMGCGLEDRGIRDRYEAMQYGWDCAIERVAECIPEVIYTTPPSTEINQQLLGEVTEVLRIFQSHLGARRSSCDELGVVLWDRIEEVIAAAEKETNS